MDRLLATRQRVDVAHWSPDIVSRLGVSVERSHPPKGALPFAYKALSRSIFSHRQKPGVWRAGSACTLLLHTQTFGPFPSVQAFNTIRRDRTHEFPSTMAFRIH